MQAKNILPWNWFKNENESENVPIIRKDRYNNPLVTLHQELDQMIENAFKGFGFPSYANRRPLFELPEVIKPSVDIAETKERYVITAEVPGVEEKDVSLKLEDDVLVIDGEKKKEKEEKKGNYHWIERSYGSFQRVISLPANANIDRVSAKFKNGVLHVEIEKTDIAEETKVKQIEIQSD